MTENRKTYQFCTLGNLFIALQAPESVIIRHWHLDLGLAKQLSLDALYKMGVDISPHPIASSNAFLIAPNLQSAYQFGGFPLFKLIRQQCMKSIGDCSIYSENFLNFFK